jgi:ketosteroid isomerase-like protein
MSRENVEIVQAVYAAAERGEGALEFFDPDIEWDLSDRVFNPKVYRGHEGVRLWAREVQEIWRKWRDEPEQFIDAGDRVVAIARSFAEAGGSGVPLSERWAQVWTVRDGRIVRMRHYRDPGEALEAVGMRE